MSWDTIVRMENKWHCEDKDIRENWTFGESLSYKGQMRFRISDLLEPSQ